MRVVLLSLAYVGGSQTGILRETGRTTVQRRCFGSGMKRRCAVREGCVDISTAGISEMLRAMLERYAGETRAYGSLGAAFLEWNALYPNEFATFAGSGHLSAPQGIAQRLTLGVSLPSGGGSDG